MTNIIRSAASIAALALAMSAVLATPAISASSEALLKRWYTLEDVCRGSTPSPKQEGACYERDNVVSKQLEARGYCYTGVFGADSHWEYAGSRAWCVQIQKRNEAEALRQIQ